MGDWEAPLIPNSVQALCTGLHHPSSKDRGKVPDFDFSSVPQPITVSQSMHTYVLCM